jgi:hypothetical protein
MVSTIVEIKEKTNLLMIRNLKILAKIEAIIVSMAN